jgi:hypothetical protein
LGQYLRGHVRRPHRPANGAEVSYLVFDDEGNGFTGRANDITAHQVIAEFWSSTTRHDRGRTSENLSARNGR